MRFGGGGDVPLPSPYPRAFLPALVSVSNPKSLAEPFHRVRRSGIVTTSAWVCSQPTDAPDQTLAIESRVDFH